MKPAVCSLCGKSALDESSGKHGDWVEFHNYQEKDSADLTHPVGLEYFCGEHLSAAQNLSTLNSDEALNELRSIFSTTHLETDESEKASWWKRLLNQ
jgi:hypothetical protein